MSISLLIVDDEKAIRDMLARYFSFRGYEVNTAENGQAALEILAYTRTDVVISDIVMPKMSGVDLLRQLRSQYPMLPVIVMTGCATMENVLACMRQRACTCIFKPFDNLQELDDAVMTAMEYLENWQNILRTLKAMGPMNVEDRYGQQYL
jgi:DNA-binding NtrC family response regulator